MKFNILIVNCFGHNEFREMKLVPRIGDRLDMSCKPLPTVETVLVGVTDETMKALGVSGKIDAIVTVN